jgi:hypothetical protein
MVDELGSQTGTGPGTDGHDAGGAEPDVDVARAAGIDRWAPIRTDYETTAISLDGIAGKHGVTRSAVRWRIKRDGWVRRNSSSVVDRPRIIVRMFRVLERQVIDLETEMDEMGRGKGRSGDKEAALLGKLAGNLEKLVALDLKVTGREPGRRSTKQMQDIRNKLIERIAELRRD